MQHVASAWNSVFLTLRWKCFHCVSPVAGVIQRTGKQQPPLQRNTEMLGYFDKAFQLGVRHQRSLLSAFICRLLSVEESGEPHHLKLAEISRWDDHRCDGRMQ